MTEQYMAEALALAASVKGAVGPNPRVGCVIVDDAGTVVGRGAHQGAGTPRGGQRPDRCRRGRSRSHRIRHSRALQSPGPHPPCSQALLDAGITRVHYAVPDPTPAAGGANTLRAHGVQVTLGPLTEQAEELLEPWLFAVSHQRPFVTCKVASTLDGNVAAADANKPVDHR